MTTRYEIKIKQDDGENLKSWRVTDFIDKVNNIYYKQELLQEIHKKLLDGVEERNIVILDKSFGIHQQYNNIGKHNLNSAKGAKNLYHLGKPFGMYPNMKIVIINLIYSVFSKLYTGFNKLGYKLDKNLLSDFIKDGFESYKNEHISLDISELKNYTYKCFESLENSQKKKALNEDIEEQFQWIQDTYKQIHEEISLFESLDNKISDEDELKKMLNKNKDYASLYQKYVNSFGKKLISNARPILGIYDEENNSIQILGTNFIKKKAIDARQLDLKQVSHNSPFTILVIASVALIVVAHQMYCNVIDKVNTEGENIITRREEEVLEAEGDVQDETTQIDEQRNREIYNSWIETKNELASLISENEEVISSEEFHHISDRIGILYMLKQIEMKLERSLEKNFDDNGFLRGEFDAKEE